MAEIRRLALAQGLLPDRSYRSDPIPPASLWLAESEAWLSAAAAASTAAPPHPSAAAEAGTTSQQGGDVPKD